MSFAGRRLAVASMRQLPSALPLSQPPRGCRAPLPHLGHRARLAEVLRRTHLTRSITSTFVFASYASPPSRLGIQGQITRLHTSSVQQGQTLYYAGLLPGGEASPQLRPVPRQLLHEVAGISQEDEARGVRMHLKRMDAGSSHVLLVGHVSPQACQAPAGEVREAGSTDSASALASPSETAAGYDMVCAAGRTMLAALGGGVPPLCPLPVTPSSAPRTTATKSVSQSTHVKVSPLDRLSYGWTQPLRLGAQEAVRCAATGLGSSLVVVRNLAEQEEDDVMYVWGANASGQLGLRREQHPSVVEYPTKVDPLPPSQLNTPACFRPRREIVQVAAGLDHSLLLYRYAEVGGSEVTQVLSSGLNADGQLGRPDVAVSADTFAPVHFPLRVNERVTSISAGGDTSFACTSQGRVFAWGNNEYGQALVYTETDQVRQPADVTACIHQAGIAGVKYVAPAGSAVAIVDVQGDVWTAGYGPLGRPTDADEGDGTPITATSKLARVPCSLSRPRDLLAVGTEYYASHAISSQADPPLSVWGVDSAAGRLGLARSLHDVSRRGQDGYPAQAQRDDAPALKIALMPHAPRMANGIVWDPNTRVLNIACTLDTLFVLVDDGDSYA